MSHWVAEIRDGIAYIPLSGNKGNGMFVRIAEKDLWLAQGRSWSLHSSNKLTQQRTLYAQASGKINGTGYHVYLHRAIYFQNRMGQGEGGVDHIDGDGLNDVATNLRLATAAQNARNSRLLYSTNKSGFRGVSWSKKDQIWLAQIRVDNKTIHLGSFKDREEAALVYDQSARYYFKDFAKLNFPDRKSPPGLPEKRVISRANASGFRGVSWSEKDRRWCASIQVKGKHKYLGGFINKEDAARAYDDAARYYFKEFAKLNFLT